MQNHKLILRILRPLPLPYQLKLRRLIHYRYQVVVFESHHQNGEAHSARALQYRFART